MSSESLSTDYTGKALSHFRAAVDTLTDAIYLTDRDSMRFIDFNETAVRITGYSREELLKLGPQDISHQSRKKLEKLFDEVIAAGEHGHITEAFRYDKEDEIAAVEHRRQALKIDGKWMIVTISQDITARKCAEDKLKRFQLAIDVSSDPIYLTDRSTMRFVDFNETAVRETGYSREELLKLGPQDISHRSRQELEKIYDEVIAAGEDGVTIEDSRYTKEGEVRTVELRRKAFRMNEHWLVVTISHDITDRKKAELAAKRLGRMFAALSATNEAIIHAASENELHRSVCKAAVTGGKFRAAAILLIDPEANTLTTAASCGIDAPLIRDVSVTLSEVHRPEYGLVGNAVNSVSTSISKDIQADKTLKPWHKPTKQKGVVGAAAIPLLQRDKIIGVLLLYSGKSEIFDDDVVGLLERMAENIVFALGNFERERARKRDQERIQYLATHDGLTDLPNRLMFSELLSHAIETAKRYDRKFSIMFVDLDRFKMINDTLGHQAGDILLKEIAKRFTDSVRDSDVVARLGGDEFVVLLQEAVTVKSVATVARRILSAAMKPINIFNQDCRVTSSIGIAMFPGNGEDTESVLKNADNAMYLAKEEGKNNYQFYSEKNKAKFIERMEIENHLRRALERDELSLEYQAKRNLVSGEINGVEALLRWHNPELGMLKPMQFIPLAEETGLIVPIGRWVLKTACAQNMAWQRDGLPPVCMAVNISLLQLNDVSLLHDIKSILDDTGMAPELLELEITESMIIHDIEHAIALLKKIKKLGIRIAIDDFGTGYSSLAQLKRFPIDTLKIDRSFIRDLPFNSEDQAITKSIIDMGKRLSLTIIAEGVETSKQEEHLRMQACDDIQGYYFSKPVTADKFATLLRTGSKSD